MITSDLYDASGGQGTTRHAQMELFLQTFACNRHAGFKSVFTISDQPHVSSNGYRFAFHANDPSGIGMVLPRWIEANGNGGGNGGSEGEQGDPGLQWPCPPGTVAGAHWRTRVWLPAADRYATTTHVLTLQSLLARYKDVVCRTGMCMGGVHGCQPGHAHACT